MDVAKVVGIGEDLGNETMAAQAACISLVYCIKRSYFKQLTRFVSMDVMVNVRATVSSD